MKPPAFDYVRAASPEEAVDALVRAGGDGKILAGGQSLMPMLNFRLLRPSVLVDINRIAGLDRIEADAGGVRIGALARHHRVETSPIVRQHLPIVSAAMAHVAHLAIRNRGTFGGSLAHGDPAAELPMLCVLLGAGLKIRRPGGHRTMNAFDFHLGPLTTALEDTELLEEITIPHLPPGTGWGFEEVARRHGDFALVAVGATLSLEEGRISHPRIAVTGVGERPVRIAAAEEVVAGAVKLDGALLEAAGKAVMDAIEPGNDLHASADYRRHVAGTLTRRAMRAAFERAGGRMQ